MVLISAFVAANGSLGQDLDEAAAAKPTGIFDQAEKSPSLVDSTDPAKLRAARAAEIRQARALYRSQQRIARLEHNLWMGYEPLRPNWNAVPMMSSRYNYRRTIYVPVYVRPR